MAGAVNSVGELVGIKPFKGGPYADNGAGDKMQANLNTYLSQLAPIIQQISAGAGITNPQTGQKGAFSDNLYGLDPLQQGQLNQAEGTAASSTHQALQNILASLGSRGLGGSSAVPAAQAYLQGNQIGTNSALQLEAGQAAFGERMSAEQMIAQMLGGAYQAQQGVTQQQGQTAQAAHATAMENLGNLFGFGLSKIPGLGGGAGGVAGGTPPITDGSQILGPGWNQPFGNSLFMPQSAVPANAYVG